MSDIPEEHASNEPKRRKLVDDSSENSSDSSCSSSPRSTEEDKMKPRRMSVDSKTVFIQKQTGENGATEMVVYQDTDSSDESIKSPDDIKPEGKCPFSITDASATGSQTFRLDGSQSKIAVNPPLPPDQPPPPLPSENVALPPCPPSENTSEFTEDIESKYGIEIPGPSNIQGRQDTHMSDSDDYDSEVDKLLDEELEASKKAQQVILVKKTICKKYTKDMFDVLPEDWVTVNHNCGLPLYLHRKSRVVTWSRPYNLGTGSARKHEIPQSAIPCLHYRKTKERAIQSNQQLEAKRSACKRRRSTASPERESSNDNKGPSEGDTQRCSYERSPNSTTMENIKPELTDGPVVSSDRKDENISRVRDSDPSEDNVKTEQKEVDETQKDSDGKQLMRKVEIESAQSCQKSLTHDEMKAYAKKIFDLEDITVRKFKSWTARREYQREQKVNSRPLIPSTTHLVTCELPPTRPGVKPRRKEFVLNPNGKGPVGILHEFVQHSLREQPRYIFKELPSSETPYCATLLIADIEYGTGYGSSKKLAKLEAAKAALSILVPKWKDLQTEEEKKKSERADLRSQEFDFFDDIAIEDPRLAYLCTTTGQPSPFQILVQCLKRNFGLSSEADIKQQISKENEKSHKIEYTMTVGKHEARVLCKNKRDGKQLASQQLLQKMHPYLKSWGNILRLYGQGSFKTPKEKREEQHEITELQTRASSNAPNFSILNKLREEMMKLARESEKSEPIIKPQIKMVDI